MPKINTHLHLALKLSEKIQIENFHSFLLGNAYPDCWNMSAAEAMKKHYKDTLDNPCDMKRFRENEETNDFNLGYYFHLWVDNRILEIDLEDISKYDCMICDMPVIGPIIQELQENEFTGKEYEAMQNIMTLESEPMPLYLVNPDKQERYNAILDGLVAEFEKITSINQ